MGARRKSEARVISPFGLHFWKRKKKTKFRKMPRSIPILDRSIQSGRDDLARLLWMPLRTRDRSLARHKLVQHLGALPIVKAHEPTGVAGHDELSVGADVDVDAIAGAVVALEHLLTVLPESVRRCIHHDLVVAGLERDRFPRRMRGCPHETVHMRFGDSLDGDWDTDFPCQDGFVVGTGDHAAIVIDKGDGCRYRLVLPIWKSKITHY